MAAAKAKNAEIPLPVDVVTGQAFSADTVAETKAVESIKDSDMVFDVGPKTSEMLAEKLKAAWYYRMERSGWGL